MAKEYILAVDQSTSASKVILFDTNCEIVKQKSKEHKQYYPKNSYIEHDANEILSNVETLIKEVTEGLDGKILYMAITNQRETAVAWDRKTGKALYNAIVWQCKRTTEFCEKLIEKGLEQEIIDKTGLIVDPYFSASKFNWLLNNSEEVKEKANQDDVLLGTIDSFLVYNLTRERNHYSDHTNASRTQLLNINTVEWDEDMMSLFGVKRNMLPKLKSCNAIYGHVREDLLLGDVVISGVIGDSQGSIVGHKCFDSGAIKSTFGTGSSIVMNTEGKLFAPANSIVSTITYSIDDRIYYGVEGMINCTGDIIKFMKDNLCLIHDMDELEPLLNNIPDNEGVYFVPALVGMGAPYWKPNARAAFVGMNRGTQREHLIRAGMESIAYQINDAVNSVMMHTGITPAYIKADGGPTKNKALIQFVCDILNKEFFVQRDTNISILGAVFMGGLGIGLWKNIEEIKSINNNYINYMPSMDDEKRNRLIKEYKNAVEKII